MAAQLSHVLFSAEIRRSRYLRRFIWLLLGTLTTAAAYVALVEASSRGLASLLLLDIGKAVAIVLGGLLAARGLYNLILTLVRRSESLQLYSKGFLWTRGGKTYKYRWTQLARFREGARGLYLFRRPLLTWGAHTLEMDDERVFRFGSIHGDTRLFARVVRPYAAYVTSVKMSRALRDDRPVRLHPRLTLYPGGVEAGKSEIRWSEVNATVKNGRLLVRRSNQDKPAKTIRRYGLHRVDNVGGFLEIVNSTHRQFQAGRKVAKRATTSYRTKGSVPGSTFAV